jgi:hypothetical protein
MACALEERGAVHGKLNVGHSKSGPSNTGSAIGGTP